MTKQKNLLIKVFGHLKSSPHENDFPSVDELYGDLYSSTYEELMSEYIRAMNSYKRAKIIHTKVKSNEKLTVDEANKIGVIQIN